MITTSDNYKNACNSTTRQSYIVAKYGNYNKTAKSLINGVSSSGKSFSSITKTYNETKSTRFNYISCEPNRVKLDENFYFISNKNNSNDNENIAFWSSSLSNANGEFATNPKIIYSFSANIDFTELTLYFQEVCETFKVNYYLDSTLVAQRNITNNSELNVETKNDEVSQTNIYFNKLEIEFIRTSEPYRYIKFNEIDFGVYEQFSKNQIIDIDIIEELNIDSSDLSSNSLNLTIDDINGEYDVLNPNNKLKKLQERQEISVYHYLLVEGAFQEMPLGTFLLKEFDSSNSQLQIEAYDDIYFMNKTYYGSNFYESISMTTILNDLFNYFNYTNFNISSECDSIYLTGYIPNVEFREALRLICEAGSCVIRKTRLGITNIYKNFGNSIKDFERKMIFSESPSRNLFNNVIDIVEYNYSNQQEETEIYNTELEIGEHTILFSKYPVKQETIKKSEKNGNYEILKVYATSCVVKVTSQTKIILKATLCEPTSIVKRIVKDENVVIDEYAINKVDNKLITKSNSTSIGNWKLSRSDIHYNFSSMQIPYIEVGDKCTYKTKYNTANSFILTKIETTKSIRQTLKGE